MKHINPVSFTSGEDSAVKDFRPKSNQFQEVTTPDPKGLSVPESAEESPADPTLLKDLKNDLDSVVLSTSQKSPNPSPVSPPQM